VMGVGLGSGAQAGGWGGGGARGPGGHAVFLHLCFYRVSGRRWLEQGRRRRTTMRVRVTARAGVRDGISLGVSVCVSLLTAGADFRI
jgi:hypothetical protein